VTGIVVVTHGNLARELMHAVEMILGPQERMQAVCLLPGDNVDDTRDRLSVAIRECDAGEGVLLLTDMFGGTPSNLALAFFAEGKVEVVMGVNLPMLLKLASIRMGTEEGEKQGLAQMAVAAVEHGRKNIQAASDILRKKPS